MRVVVMVMMLLGVVVFRSGREKGSRPVVIVHGIFDGPKQFRTLSRFIKEVNSLSWSCKKTQKQLDHIGLFVSSNFVVSFLFYHYCMFIDVLFCQKL